MIRTFITKELRPESKKNISVGIKMQKNFQSEADISIQLFRPKVQLALLQNALH